MSGRATDRIRAATAADTAQLLVLWASVFEDEATRPLTTWKEYAHEWFIRVVADPMTACFPVIEVDGDVVATAIGTLELGVPNPECLRGRTVRLANVITVPEHRGKGYGTRLVLSVVEWARSINADRVDLSATPDGRRIYERVGFTTTRAPRMKLVL
jgi:GNAT superfamily N-acetyltransferase